MHSTSFAAGGVPAARVWRPSCGLVQAGLEADLDVVRRDLERAMAELRAKASDLMRSEQQVGSLSDSLRALQSNRQRESDEVEQARQAQLELEGRLRQSEAAVGQLRSAVAERDATIASLRRAALAAATQASAAAAGGESKEGLEAQLEKKYQKYKDKYEMLKQHVDGQCGRGVSIIASDSMAS